MLKEIKDIVIVGSGNVAYHLINAFKSKGINILQLLARNEHSAHNLSKIFNIPYTTDPKKLKQEADLYILAVQDDQIRKTALGLKLKDRLMVHTSGFSPLETLKGCSGKSGVIWPLQTLTAGKEVNYGRIPFFIEGSNDDIANTLSQFLSQVSDNVMVTTSPVRQQIHLAAVIASNFANHLYSEAASILEKNGIPYSVLVPLILETAGKATHQHPHNSQTGPAVRNDVKVIKKHLELLRYDPAFQEIYRLISENIIHHHYKNQ